MRFLIDAQLPSALARWLVARGHEAEHVGDSQMQAAGDAEIWFYAVSSGATVITKDDDFAKRKALVDDGPIVEWVRLQNNRRTFLLEWLDAMLPEIERAIGRGETLIEAS